MNSRVVTSVATLGGVAVLGLNFALITSNSSAPSSSKHVGVVGTAVKIQPKPTKATVLRSTTAVCGDIPAKMWNGKWHFSPAIKSPQKLEHYCVTYPISGGTKVMVSLIAVPK